MKSTAKRGFRGRNDIAIRLVTLIRLLNRHRYMPPVPDLAKALDVHVRTVYRDLNALEAAYWPLPMRLRDGEVVQERRDA